MLRFACPPTRDMTIDDLRVALGNFHAALERKENFIVRIEDADKERNIEGKDQEILDILALFGVTYSQVQYQSQNYRFYSAMALDLLHKKKAFNCFCPFQDLEKSYAGGCDNLPAELVIDNPNPFTVRIKKTSDDTDSFVILKQDKTPTYDFASAIDDMLSDVSLVICQETYKSNALKQEQIRKALGYDKEIEYSYMPDFLNDTPSIKSLLEEGLLPSAISNYLILTSKTPSLFDKTILRSINKEELKNLDDKELSRYVGFADAEIGKLAKLFLEEAATTKELREKIKPVFEPKTIPTEFKEAVQKLIDVIKKAPYFERYDDFEKYVCEQSNLQGENLFKPLRLLLTGFEQGPELCEIYTYVKNYLGEIVK